MGSSTVLAAGGDSRSNVELGYQLSGLWQYGASKVGGTVGVSAQL